MDGPPISSLVSGAQPNGVGLSGGDALKSDALVLYQRLLPVEWLEQVRRQEKLRENNRVYTHAVVMWLMIRRRWQGGTLETAVLELLRGLPESFWPRPCKRLRPTPEPAGQKLSSHTGAYNKARQNLPGSMVEQCADRVFAQLTKQMAGTLAARIFLGWHVGSLAAQRSVVRDLSADVQSTRRIALAVNSDAANDAHQAQQLWNDVLYYVGQAKLPQRNRPRPSYPRAVWGKPQVYPKRKA